MKLKYLKLFEFFHEPEKKLAWYLIYSGDNSITELGRVHTNDIYKAWEEVEDLENKKDYEHIDIIGGFDSEADLEQWIKDVKNIVE